VSSFRIASATLSLASVCLAADWTLGPFTRPEGANPVISPRPASVFDCPIRHAPVHWEALHTFNPAAIVRNGRIYLLYRAEDSTGAMSIGGHTSRLGLASSTDGAHFKREPTPVFYPAPDSQRGREWPGGCEDPRIVEADDGTYFLTYTQWNGKIWRAAVASSKDLHAWTKYGPLFASAGSKYADFKYKSAGIVCRQAHGRLIAARIRGVYWMYWGEGTIRLATSNDLIHWTPLEDHAGNAISVLKPRPGRFDSEFPETGPPPVLTPAGIVVLYNGKNAALTGDPSLESGAYSAGEALFSASNPAHLLARLDHPVLEPAEPFEKSGQYAAGTTFAEGLVWFHHRWFLYYGCADSLVGVAASPPTAETR
jgi:predicted GH43/DUF377 family glycosyl hydrolase